MDDESKRSVYELLKLIFTEEGAIEFFIKNVPPSTLEVYGKGHADVYRTLCEFHHKTGLSPLDEQSYKRWAASNTLIVDAIGGTEALEDYLRRMDETNPSTAQATATMLRLHSNRTKQRDLIGQLTKLDEKVDGYTETVDGLTREIADLNRSESDPLKSVYDGDRIAAGADALWDLPDFLPTPFKALNKAIAYDEDAGFCRGAVHAILARSGYGKSTLAKVMANHWVEEGHRVLFVNYEEAVAHWERVLFTQITGQNIYQSGRDISDLDKKHYTEMFKAKMSNWGDRFMVRHDPDTPYFEDMETWVREVAAKRQVPDVLVIDTIQSMFMKSGKNNPRWMQYEEMMVRLEKLAKDLHCAIVITAQENANRMKDKREVVQQSDIGGSLSIAQKCSVTIFITQAKTSLQDDAMDETIMQLQIPKNRITGVTTMMDCPLVRYNDATKSYEEYDMPDVAYHPNYDHLADPY